MRSAAGLAECLTEQSAPFSHPAVVALVDRPSQARRHGKEAEGLEQAYRGRRHPMQYQFSHAGSVARSP